MKFHSRFISLVLFVFLLTACGADAAQEGVDLAEIYTAAAASVEAQMSPTGAAATSTPAATATLITIPTTAPMTVTPQSAAFSSSSSQVTANGCNNALYVSDVTISDGTILAPDESFVKTWKFQNTGTCAWQEDYLITFTSGNSMDGDNTEIGEEVASGSTAEISVSLVAPSSEGSYTGYWKLADTDGNEFGQSVYVMIVVSDDASTLTPTATAEDEDTDATSTPTTVAATATTAPTLTFTATAVPTTIPTDTTEPAATSEPTK
ncbi:MAG TPA: NBR1-Ig-like domain-containing protein [Anaerolineales bacterium]|nr:NBR1-Ig-like domain-containing protein [Anaerolineales bacterium]